MSKPTDVLHDGRHINATQNNQPSAGSPATVVPRERVDSSYYRFDQKAGNFTEVGSPPPPVLVSVPYLGLYFRAAPGEQARGIFALVESRKTGCYNLVSLNMATVLGDHAQAFVLYLCQDCDGQEFFFPIPVRDARSNMTVKTSHQAVWAAQNEWLSLDRHSAVRGYTPGFLKFRLPDPRWSGRGFEELLLEAFKDRIIDSYDHPVAMELLGLP